MSIEMFKRNGSTNTSTTSNPAPRKVNGIDFAALHEDFSKAAKEARAAGTGLRAFEKKVEDLQDDMHTLETNAKVSATREFAAAKRRFGAIDIRELQRKFGLVESAVTTAKDSVHDKKNDAPEDIAKLKDLIEEFTEALSEAEANRDEAAKGIDNLLEKPKKEAAVPGAAGAVSPYTSFSTEDAAPIKRAEQLLTAYQAAGRPAFKHDGKDVIFRLPRYKADGSVRKYETINALTADIDDVAEARLFIAGKNKGEFTELPEFDAEVLRQLVLLSRTTESVPW